MSKTIRYLAAALVLLAGLTLPVQARGAGSIRVWLDPKGLPVTEGAVTLYQVGHATQQGYQLYPAWGGGIIPSQQIHSPNLAALLAEMAQGEGECLYLDADGCAEFTDLEDGVYLLVQSQDMEGFYPIEPFLVTLPGQGTRAVQASPKTRPIVVAQPAPGNPTTADPFLLGIWQTGLTLSCLGLSICWKLYRKRYGTASNPRSSFH